MLPAANKSETAAGMDRSQLKEIMRRNGWSRRNVADVAKVSQHTVNAWLRPHTNLAHRPVTKQHAAILWEAAGVKK